MRSLQDGQNYLLAPVNSSGSRNVLMGSGIDEVKRRGIISNFSSWMSTHELQFVKVQEDFVDY